MNLRRLPRAVAPVTAAPGQESAWDYPRPARCEPTDRHLIVIFGREVVAETRRAYRVLETSHPPGYYIPTRDWRASVLVPVPGSSWCEWKGQAQYYDVHAAGQTARHAAWGYPEPTPAFAAIADCVSVYPGLVDRCVVDGIEVIPQAGGFYGGWITPDVVGPFKGESGTWGW